MASDTILPIKPSRPTLLFNFFGERNKIALIFFSKYWFINLPGCKQEIEPVAQILLSSSDVKPRFASMQSFKKGEEGVCAGTVCLQGMCA